MNVTLTSTRGTVVVRGGSTKPVSLAAPKVPLKLERSGRSGPAGPEGPRGLPGEVAGDPGDLTLIFDNKLI